MVEALKRQVGGQQSIEGLERPQLDDRLGPLH
ncbi:hypothetical protein A1F94_013626 [Pyrenophora tritici-repentis]|nr:hypothetical protein A1F94_013626 [Pyrenophora tritici-repentis]